jgi:glutaredoxin 3
MSHVEMYSSELCGFCYRARMLLESKGVGYVLRDVNREAGCREEMVQRSRRHTVPQIFIDGLHVGGCDELYALERSGRLDSLLGVVDEPGPGAR